MTVATMEGREVHVDAEGFLTDPEEWDEGLAATLATAHFRPLTALASAVDYYRAYQTTPPPADKVADFELFWTTVRTKVMASDKADYKAMLEGLKIYKLAGEPQPGPGGVLSLTYLFYAEKTAAVTYDPTQLLYKSGIWEYADAELLYPKLKDAITALQPWPLTKVGG